MDITVNATVKNIVFTSTGGLCGASGATATYEGNTTVTAKTAGGVAKDLTISHK